MLFHVNSSYKGDPTERGRGSEQPGGAAHKNGKDYFFTGQVNTKVTARL